MIPLSTLALMVRARKPGAVLRRSFTGKGDAVFQIHVPGGKPLSGWHTTERYAWQEARRRVKREEVATPPGGA